MLTLAGGGGPRRGPALKDLGIIPDGAVLIRGNLIQEVGPSRRVENLAAARDAIEINATGQVVMPGMVDCHTHLVHGAPWLKHFEARGAEREVERQAALRAAVQGIHACSAARLQRRARTIVERMIRHGTTTVEAKSGYGLDQTGELKILRVIAALNEHPAEVVPTLLGAMVVPAQYGGHSWEYLYWLCGTLMPKVRRRKLAVFADVNCATGAFNLEQAGRYMDIARQLGFVPKVHAGGTECAGAAALAARMGAASADLPDEAVQEDIDALARSDTVATLLPAAAFDSDRDRYPPARALIDAGAAVALGTDFNPETSPTYSMQAVVSLACTRMRMSAAEAIAAATINAAHALRRADVAGSLEPGKQADLLVIDASDYREIPHRFGVNLVRAVIKRGAPVYREAQVESNPDAIS